MLLLLHLLHHRRQVICHHQQPWTITRKAVCIAAGLMCLFLAAVSATNFPATHVGALYVLLAVDYNVINDTRPSVVYVMPTIARRDVASNFGGCHVVIVSTVTAVIWRLNKAANAPRVQLVQRQVGRRRNANLITIGAALQRQLFESVNCVRSPTCH